MPPGLLLRKDERAIALDLENAATPLEEIDIRVGKSRADLGRQTGSPRFVVSDYAVSNGDVHGCRLELRVSRKSVQGGTATPARLASCRITESRLVMAHLSESI
jgi:hypothetical protein